MIQRVLRLMPKLAEIKCLFMMIIIILIITIVQMPPKLSKKHDVFN